MYRTMLCAAVLGTALLVSGAATAGPMNVQATLTINLGNLSPVVVNGSGLGSSAAPGGAATLASGALSTNLAAPVSPPLIIVNGIGLGASGLTGSPLILNTATPTHPPLVAGMLNWGGATGTMPLNGSAYLLFIQTPPVAAALPTGVPLSVVGVGGTAIAGGLVASVIGAPFQLGAVVGTGTLLGSATQQTATGFDARTAGGAGVLQIVSPTRVNLGGLVAGDYVSALAILNLNFTPVPEPTTGILLGAGVLALAAAGGLRRRSRRRIE